MFTARYELTLNIIQVARILSRVIYHTVIPNSAAVLSNIKLS